MRPPSAPPDQPECNGKHGQYGNRCAAQTASPKRRAFWGRGLWGRFGRGNFGRERLWGCGRPSGFAVRRQVVAKGGGVGAAPGGRLWGCGDAAFKPREVDSHAFAGFHDNRPPRIWWGGGCGLRLCDGGPAAAAKAWPFPHQRGFSRRRSGCSVQVAQDAHAPLPFSAAFAPRLIWCLRRRICHAGSAR
jgi:hypothetical protein